MTTQTLTLVMLYLNRLHLDTYKKANTGFLTFKGATIEYDKRLN